MCLLNPKLFDNVQYKTISEPSPVGGSTQTSQLFTDEMSKQVHQEYSRYLPSEFADIIT